MIRAHELARLLLAGPNAPVETWQNAARYPVDACDQDIEAVVQVESANPLHEHVIILGMDMAELQGEVLWTDRPGIVKAASVAMPVIDLFEALKASLEQAKKAQGGR